MTDKELIYLCAFRYALGRKTFIVSTVIDFLRQKKLSKRAKEIMIKEIDEAFSLGDECDKQKWIAFRKHLEITNSDNQITNSDNHITYRV